MSCARLLASVFIIAPTALAGGDLSVHGKEPVAEVQNTGRNVLWPHQNYILLLKPSLLNSICFVSAALSKKLLSNYISARVGAQILKELLGYGNSVDENTE